MNERIVNLIAEQCYEHDQSWTGVGQRIFNKEKFAELIVRECSNFLKDTLDDHFAAEQLEEHFGVEE
jgi:hypothetical protein